MIGRRVMAMEICFLLLAVFAHAVSKTTLRIKVLNSETRAVLDDENNGVPLNCDQLTFDAYCRSSTTPRMTSTLLVQEGDGPPFRITCKIESRFSSCTPLPIGQSFDARREKRGMTVYYIDDKGKPRKQFYTLAAADTSAAASTVPGVAAVVQPSASPRAAAQAQNSASLAVAPAASSTAATAGSSEKPLPGWVKNVKCNFNSTPAGAEIVVDGRYVGNTPSEIGLSPGNHDVHLSMPGFAEWKRELAVEPDSVVNVTAALQKAQP